MSEVEKLSPYSMAEEDTDPVRVLARELREKLAAYQAHVGKLTGGVLMPPAEYYPLASAAVNALPTLLSALDEAERVKAENVRLREALGGLTGALAKVCPITTHNTPDYAELTFGDHQTQAMTMQPDDWNAIDAAFLAARTTLSERQSNAG